MLFFLLNFLYFLLAISPFFYLKKIINLPYFNPLTIIILVNIPIDMFKMIIGPIFIVENLNDNGLLFAYAMTDLKMLCQIIVLIFLLKLSTLRKFTLRLTNTGDQKFNTKHLKIISNYFLIISFAFFLILMINSGVYFKWIFDSREAYINNRAGSGLFYALSINFISLSFFFRCFSSNRVNTLLKYFIFYFLLLIPFGSKGLFVNFLIFFLIIVYKNNKNILLKISIPALGVVIGLILYNFRANLVNNSFSDIVNYFDFYLNASKYYNDYLTNNIPLFYGKIYFTSFWDYIPRSIFPDKPAVYGILNIVENYFPGGPESGNTPAFGGEVASFADFGILGVIFSSVFDFSLLIKAISILYIFKYKKFDFKMYTILDLMILMITFSPSYGIYAPSIYFFILTLFVLFVIFIIKKVKLKA